ncbi:hypothetical protein CcaCcLH18_01890 [Colletotrichum camelliae]|nr:hypothetical protein CcaCcLH18_01890 [Colletotrichum camelliae]
MTPAACTASLAAGAAACLLVALPYEFLVQALLPPPPGRRSLANFDLATQERYSVEGRTIRVHRVPSQVPKSPRAINKQAVAVLDPCAAPPGLQVVPSLYQSWAPKASPRSFPARIGLHLYESQIFGSKKPQSQRQSCLSQLDKTYMTVHSR